MICRIYGFIAPKIVNKQAYYVLSIDMWALGVVLFVILTKVFQFKSQTDKDLNRKIWNARYPIITSMY